SPNQQNPSKQRNRALCLRRPLSLKNNNRKKKEANAEANRREKARPVTKKTKSSARNTGASLTSPTGMASWLSAGTASGATWAAFPGRAPIAAARHRTTSSAGRPARASGRRPCPALTCKDHPVEQSDGQRQIVQVLVFSGSLRADSLNTRLADLAAA